MPFELKRLSVLKRGRTESADAGGDERAGGDFLCLCWATPPQRRSSDPYLVVPSNFDPISTGVLGGVEGDVCLVKRFGQVIAC